MQQPGSDEKLDAPLLGDRDGGRSLSGDNDKEDEAEAGAPTLGHGRVTQGKGLMVRRHSQASASRACAIIIFMSFKPRCPLWLHQWSL